MIKICAISDTHTNEYLVKVPKCDILIHAGDFGINSLSDVVQTNKWFAEQPAKHKIFVGGNHDGYLEQVNYHNACSMLQSCHYLYNNSINIMGLNIWGSPFSPIFNNWAFMRNELDLSLIWEKIPENTDIVITHAPPNGILDLTSDNYNAGSYSLSHKISEIQPKLHIFGHIHEQYGEYDNHVTKFVNASQMTREYKLKNKPIIINL